MSSNINNPNAIMFDGSSFYLYNTVPPGKGGGLNAYLRSPSPYGLLSFWYWTSDLPGNNKARTILKMNPAAGFAGGLVKVSFRKNVGETTPRLYIRVQSAAGDFVRFRTAPVPYADRKYHHLLVTWNASANPNTLPDCYLDGKPLAWEIEERAGAATFTVDYKLNQNFYIGTDGALLGTASKEGPFRGILSEIFFDPIRDDFGVGVGAGGDALVYTFFDSKKSKYAFRAGRIGSDGGTVLEREPAIYLHGYYTDFLFNHGGSSSFRASGPVVPPDPAINDPFWWGFWSSTKNFFEGGASTYEFEEPTATGSGPRDTGGKRASLFNVPTLLHASASEVKPAIADSPTGLVSFWFRPISRNFAAQIFTAGLRKATGPENLRGYYAGLSIDIGDPDGFGVLSVTATNMTEPGTGGEIDDSNATAIFSFWALTQSPPFDGKWHHIIVAWDTAVPACVAFVDGTQVTMTDVYSSGSQDHQFVATPYASAGYETYVGGTPTASGEAFDGPGPKWELSELYINIANHDFVDALTSELVAKFRQGATNTAREIGVTASAPFGAAGPKPNFYLSGGPSEFVNSFAKTAGTLGHIWGADGTDTDSTFSLHVIGGPLAPSESDPFKAKELVS